MDKNLELNKWIGTEALGLAFDIAMTIRNPTNVENDLRKIFQNIKDWHEAKLEKK